MHILTLTLTPTNSMWQDYFQFALVGRTRNTSFSNLPTPVLSFLTPPPAVSMESCSCIQLSFLVSIFSVH